MNSIAIKRIMAFFADYLFIAVYGGLLVGVMFLLRTFAGINPGKLPPGPSIVLDFILFSLPVMLYFIIMENKKGGTIGKQLFELRVGSVNGGKAPANTILARNIIKFLPWHIAHVGIRVFIYNMDHHMAPGAVVWIMLLMPQAFLLIYLFSIILSNGKQSLYDKFSGAAIY